MRRVIEMRPRGTWSGEAIGTVTLPFADRHRRRIRMTDDRGEPFLLDLAEPALLVEGDGLVLDAGGMISVCAAPEPVADIQCRDGAHAARVAWHIGNRHTAVQVLEDGRLRIADDHVLIAMVEGLGARVLRHTAPFQPEPGAYAGADGRIHDHGDDHGHSRG